MGVVIPVGLAQANIVMSLNGKVAPMAMTLGVLPQVPMTASLVANRVHLSLISTGSLFAPLEVAAMSNQWSYDGVNVTLMTGTGPILGSATANVNGTATQAGLVVNGALLVRKTTAQGGRKNRGRLFMPPAYVHEINVDANGNIAPPIPGDMQNRFQFFFDALETNELEPMLLHSLAAALPPTAITSFVVEDRIATQRRRLR